MEGDIQLDEDEERVQIQDLTIEDSDVFRYLKDVEPETREAEIRRSLKMGVVALRTSRTAGEVDYGASLFGSAARSGYRVRGDVRREDSCPGIRRATARRRCRACGRIAESECARLTDAPSQEVDLPEIDELEMKISGEEVREGW